MKAIVHSRYGAPDVLELKDIDQPVINDDAVLVRVHAAAVGKGDWLTVRGLPYVARMRYGLPKPKHPVPGFDVAGRIEAVGSNVTQLQPGDEVFGWCEGSFAEYASVPEGQLALKPPTSPLSRPRPFPSPGSPPSRRFVTPEGSSQASGRHHRCLGRGGQLRGPAGQGVRRRGDRVCSTKSLDMVRSIGADHVIDYTQQDFTRSGQRYDLILEMAGIRSLADLRRRSPPGTLVSSEDRAAMVHGDRSHPQSGGGVPVRAPAAALVFLQAKESGPGCPEGAHRSRQGHPGDRPNLPAELGP